MIDRDTLTRTGWTRFFYCQRCRNLTCTHHGLCWFHYFPHSWRFCLCHCGCGRFFRWLRSIA